MERTLIPTVEGEATVVIQAPGPLLVAAEPNVVVVVRIRRFDHESSAFLDFEGLNALRSTLDVLHAQAVFATLGEEVAAADVPALVRAGRMVFSYGYGSNLDIDDFTTIGESDLWAWASNEMPDLVEQWGPYRVAPTTERILERTITVQGPPSTGKTTIETSGIKAIWIGPGEPSASAIEDAESIAHILDNLPS
jgi:hypothetical protein